jgi:hypothetical protein
MGQSRSKDHKKQDADRQRAEKARSLLSKRDKAEVVGVANRRSQSMFSQEGFFGALDTATKQLAGRRGAFTTKPGGDIKVSRRKKK